MNITIVAGARPNFIKIAPIIKSINKFIKDGFPIHYRLVHTGQHYDNAMSGSFFEQLSIPVPDINPECGGVSQAEQTASIMVKFEQELKRNKPDVVIVVGDVTSTMACTIAAKKLCIDVAHVEAGIRSGDMNMPEEINRMITDSICNHYFTTTVNATKNLTSVRIPIEKVHFVGNTMIDTLFQHINNIKRPAFFHDKNITENDYFLLTLHRPSNVDDVNDLHKTLQSILDSTDNYKILFPVHPRTKKNIEEKKYNNNRLIIIDPQAYLEFLYMIKHSKAIITDSGGITEEATVMKIPCLTLRNSTERPETIEIGTNELIGNDSNKLAKCIRLIINGQWKNGKIPTFWDGHTSDRIISILCRYYLIDSVNTQHINTFANEQ